MNPKSILRKLNKAIADKNSDNIKFAEELIIENIEHIYKEPLFYSLPFDEISNIIKRIEFGNNDEVTEPFELLHTLLKKTSEVHEKEAVLLLNDLKIDNLPQLTIDEIISILSKFTKNELLTKLGELYTEEKSLLRPDYEHIIEEQNHEIAKLKEELQAKNKENNELKKQITEHKDEPKPKKKTPLTETLKESKFPPVTEKPSDFEPDVFIACMENKLSSIQYLFEVQKENPDKRDWLGRTVLHLACELNNLPMVQYLCEVAKFNTEAKDQHGKTPLSTSCDFMCYEIIKYLCEVQKVNIEEVSEKERKYLESLGFHK